MKTCKFCNAEMAEDSTVCPSCGKENEEAPEARLSAGKTVFAIAAVVAVLILLAAVVLNGQAPIVVTETTAAAEETVQTEPPTVPADGNPDDATCKGTYTAAEDAVIAAKDTVIATSGDRELTVGQFQVFYWMEVRNFLTQYGAYAAYFGLDYQQGLDTQVCGISDVPMTWQQYFVETALNAWASYSSMAEEADAKGYQMSEAQAKNLAGIADDLSASALEYGFTSGDDMIHQSLGAAADLDGYKYFMELYYKANGYYNALAEQVVPTDADLEAFYAEHEEGYIQSGITKDSKYVDVRHVLIYPQGADGTNLNTEEFSEEAWSASETQAQALLDEWLAGDKTEESFAAFANEHSQDPGSNTNGGLYTNVTEGEMVAAFNDWCFDSQRQKGDTGIVKTEYGFHIMYFSDSRPMWLECTRSDFIAETANSMVSEIEAKSPLTVKYSEILLADAALE